MRFSSYQQPSLSISLSITALKSVKCWILPVQAAIIMILVISSLVAPNLRSFSKILTSLCLLLEQTKAKTIRYFCLMESPPSLSYQTAF